MPSPLAPVRDEIDPGQTYTVTSLAQLLAVSTSTIQALASAGWLPAGRRERISDTVSGWRHVWRGRDIIRAAERKRRPPLDHDRFSPVTLWRLGCRCDACTGVHNQQTRDSRRAAADAVFPQGARNSLLAAVSAGMPLPEAAAQEGVTATLVYGRALRDPEFSEALDEAAWGLCVLGRTDSNCSTPTAYRHSQCRGTGCRQMRRESSRRERSSG